MAFKGFLPSPGASPKGLLPKSSVKRRKFLHESEDDSGHMYIEQYIYRRDRYRSSSVPFPFPLPMSLESIPVHLSSTLRIDAALRQLVNKRLTDQGIQARSIQVLLQYKHGYPKNGDKRVPVLLIWVDAGETNPLERWSAARRDITNDLDENGLSELEVEIQDPARHYQPSLFPIHPNNKAVALYKSIREELLVRIYDSIGPKWQLLSLFEVGRMANSKKATVIVIVSPLTEGDWSILKSSLEAIIRREQGNFGVSLQVQIMPGSFRAMLPSPQDDLEDEEQEPLGQSFLVDYNTHPRHGTSIGVQGERGGGTLGGFFRMVSPTKTHIGFLTNSHVVAPPHTAPEKVRTQYDFQGLRYKAPPGDPGRTWLDYFAVKDVEATIAKATTNIDYFRRQIAEEESFERTREERGRSTRDTKANLEAARTQFRQSIQETEESLRSARKMPRLYGRTILASGRALTSDLKTLDFAFVETSEVGDTRLPDRSTFDTAKVSPMRLGFSQPLSLPPKYNRFSNIRPGNWYFKVGRTTGLTSGICNGVEAWTRPRKQHTLFNAKGGIEAVRKTGRKLKTEMVELEKGHTIERLVYGENGKPVEMEGEEGFYYASEWVIVNGSVDPLSSWTQENFCASGDSGSLIIDIQGRVAGLLWGDLRGFCGPATIERPYIGAGMVTDIDDIKSFMKGALGWPKDSDVDVLRFP